MILTAENYYSQEANKEYLSVSQYKDFCGSIGRVGCEEQALAKINGKWEIEKTSSLLVGAYVDAHFEGTLDLFKAKNPEVFTQKGTLRSEFKKAEEIINRIERDEYFMKFLSGQKQRIFTAELFGAKWKVKLDSYIPGICITDLKIMKSLTENHFVRDYGNMDFIKYWGYDVQAAVYQEVVRICTGEKLPFFIAAASKESEPDIRVIQVPQEWMDERLSEVQANIPKILALKNGDFDPIRCEYCDYCRHTRVLTHPILPDELVMAV